MKRGFKETEIGEIPNEWEVSCLESCVENGLISDGDWIESKDQDTNGDIRLIQLADIGDGYFVDKSKRFINDSTYTKLKCIGLNEGDILIARMPDPIGRACLLPKLPNKSITAVDICIVRVKRNIPYFVCNVINSRYFRSLINQNISGSTRQRVPTGYLKSIPFPLPPLPEQRKIAEILSSVDEAIRTTQAVIDQTKILKQGLLNQLLTKGIGHKKFKQTEIGEIPVEWEVKTLCNLTTKIGDGLHGTPEYVSASSYYFVNGNNLVNGEIKISNLTKCVSPEEMEKHSVVLNDSTILLSINGTVGNLAYYNGESIVLGKSVAYINVSSLLQKYYLYYFLMSDSFKSYIQTEKTGTTISNFSLASIRNLPVVVPPLPEQERIAEALSSVDETIRENTNNLDQLKATKFGLMQDLLTGKKRVHYAQP